MNNKEFLNRLYDEASKHMAFRHSSCEWNLHRLMYLIRVCLKMDCSLSSSTGECIPSVNETFVPLKWLSRPVGYFEYEEEYNVVFFDFLDCDCFKGGICE